MANLISLSRVAVVGAGLSGLVAAREMQNRGASVILFEKARGPGGRLATRRLGECVADFGAQFFSAFSEDFQGQVRVWQTEGLVFPWFEKKGAPRFRASESGMNALAKNLAQELVVSAQTRVAQLRVLPSGQIELLGVKGGPTSGGAVPQESDLASLGVFDGVVLSAPLPQCLELLEPLVSDLSPAWKSDLVIPESGLFDPCLAWMGLFDESQVRMSAPGFLDQPTPDLQAVASSRLKGLRVSPGLDVVTAHLSPSATQAHSQKEDAALTQVLLSLLEEQNCIVSGAVPRAVSLQRWRYSQPSAPSGARWRKVEVRGTPDGIALCGDYWGGPRVEGAFLSGLAAGRSYGQGRN